MEITPLVPGDRQVIQSYGKGEFWVSDLRYQGAIFVFQDKTVPWAAAPFADLTLESFALLRDVDPPVEVLLIGTGARMALLPSALRVGLRALGVGVETMDTGAACRTYNVLLAEERRVAAALLPVG